MTKTLADMNTEERLDSIGMWATVDTERYRAVIVRTYAADDVDYAQMLCPEIMDYYTTSLISVTPLPDLPRAWAPDGTPPAGEWEHTHIPALGESTRRWIGDWEQA
ncbi:TPA: hypothetical protein JAK17_000765 [Corynebacterium striatum]|nr:hypothetical protein [Corynebacterium striatum]